MAARANTTEIVLSANKFSVCVTLTNESIILTAANIIKKDILQYCSEKTKRAWPPTTEQFLTSVRNITESVHLFLKELLKLEKHSVSRSENITRVVESYATDSVNAVSRGGIMPSKHFLLGL